MAATVLTITVEEGKAAEYEQLLCEDANLPVSPANARQVAVSVLRGHLQTLKRRKAQTAETPVEGIT